MCDVHGTIRLIGEKRNDRTRAYVETNRICRSQETTGWPCRAEGKYYSNSLCTSAIRPPLADALISQGLTKHRSALLVPNLELSATAPRPNLCFSRISVLLFSQKGREGPGTGTMPVILLPLRR